MIHWHIPPGSKWDMDIVLNVLTERRFTAPIKPRDTSILVVPGSEMADSPGALQSLLRKVKDPLVIVTSDESRRLNAYLPHMLLQTPRMDELDRGFPLGHPPSPRIMDPEMPSWASRTIPWSFMGQITHSRRQEFSDAVRILDDGFFRPTTGFAQGISREGYLSLMEQTVYAPCPSGPATVDTFRLYEAIEAGCAPIVDTRTPQADMSDYWHGLCPHATGLVEAREWSGLPLFMATDGRSMYHAARAQAWWGRALKFFSDRVWHDQIGRFGPDNYLPGDEIGVVITTSPCPGHPSTAMIQKVVASVRERLPRAHISIACDVPRDPDPAYDEYLARLAWKTTHCWTDVTMAIASTHGHQSEAIKDSLGDPHWPRFTLFLEHDTPLVGRIDFDELAGVLAANDLDLIRLHHEAQVLDVHRHLMVGDGPRDYDGTFREVTAWPTVQWSQRPHLASTAYYRRILSEHFRTKHWFVEEVMHSVCQSEPWERNRLAVLHEIDGSWGIKRSEHLDGRRWEG